MAGHPSVTNSGPVGDREKEGPSQEQVPPARAGNADTERRHHRAGGTPGFGDELEAMEKEKLETHAVYNERDGFGWRFHSCISNVRREWRYCYRVYGRALHMSDVANSQPLVLASVLRERGVPGLRRVRPAVRGRDDLRHGSEGRGHEQAGGEENVVTIHRLLRQESLPYQVAPVAGGRFPSVWHFIRQVKRTDYARLSRMLQRQESKIVLYTACESLVLAEDVFLVPIHDALLYLPEHRAIVEGRIQAGFRQVRRGRDRQAHFVREKRGSIPSSFTNNRQARQRLRLHYDR